MDRFGPRVSMLTIALLNAAHTLARSPSDFVRSMGIGINLGNTLDAPEEGKWAPPAQEVYFDAYVSAGFTSVRVPCSWGRHISDAPPYITVHNKFLDRVHEVVGWSIKRNLTTVVNTHHDDWLDGSKNETAFAHNLERLVAIWAAVGERLSDVPDELLAFEVYNEPHLQMTTDWLNRMNAAVLPAIRATNPTRVVFLGGLKFMNPHWIIQHPDAIAMLPASGPADPYLALEVHSYDPFDFCGGSKGPTAHSWEPDVISGWADPLRAWGSSRNVSILLGEFGCTKLQTNRSGRLSWYREMGSMARSHGFAATAWDDSGHFELLHRSARTWDEGVLNALFGRKPVEKLAIAEEVEDVVVRELPDPSWRPMDWAGEKVHLYTF